MKRVLIFCVVVGLFAGQASAGMYTMDEATAIQLRDVFWSDAESSSENVLNWVGYNPGTNASDKVFGTNTYYGATMEYAVGFAGNLSITGGPGDNFASVLIGLGSSPSTETYTGFYLPISNDNQQTWEYKLYVDTTGTDYLSPSWTSISGPAYKTLTLDFGGDVDFDNVTDIGFIVQFNKSTTGEGTNSSDDFHTSVVPVPGAVILGILGLGVVGLKLRKYA